MTESARPKMRDEKIVMVVEWLRVNRAADEAIEWLKMDLQQFGEEIAKYAELGDLDAITETAHGLIVMCAAIEHINTWSQVKVLCAPISNDVIECLLDTFYAIDEDKS